MKKLLTALLFGIALILVSLPLLGGKLTPPVQAGENYPRIIHISTGQIPPPQAGTGIIRVALTGTDTPGCGSVAAPCATVQYGVDEANPGDEILITAGSYTGLQTRNGLTQLAYISKSLTIRGGYDTGFTSSNPLANPTILDGQLLGRVFLITDTGPVTLENLTVTRGAVTGLNLCTDPSGNCGGGILATGPLTLINVDLVENRAERFGGGVAALATAAVTGGRFESNTAYSGFGSGGGLYAEGPVSLSGVTFDQNSSGSAGGGMYVSNSPVEIADSTFVRNQSFFNVGGALNLSFQTTLSGLLTISNSNFLSNSAGISATNLSIVHGGAIRTFNANVTIADSNFENNRCLKPDCDGGALSIIGSSFSVIPTLRMSNSSVISNSAGRNGGGIYNNGQSNLTTSLFERNSAGGDPGQAFSQGGGGLASAGATITATHFISNTSGEDGGGALISGNFFALTARLDGAEFSGNRAAGNGGGLNYGGFGLNPPVLIQNSRFANNTADLNGGGWWSNTGAVVNMSGNRFEGNRANGPENDGGFLRTERGGGGAWVGGPVRLTNDQFINNTAVTNGGGLHARDRAVLNAGLFQQNQALGNFVSLETYGGGGLYVTGNLSFTNTNFIDNLAALVGGGLWSSGSIEGSGGLFELNSSGIGGGGLWGSNNLKLTGTRLIRNITERTGGGAVALGPANLTNVLFESNQVISTTFGSGGGLRAAAGLTATTTQFVGNSTTTNGGGASTFGPVRLIDTRFQENTSDGSGGGLSAFMAIGETIEATNTQFLNNLAITNGGGIAASGPIDLTESLLQNNRSDTGSGGGLYTSGQLFSTNSQFIGNTATLDGGGAWANSGAILTGSRFENNLSSGGNGGGLATPLGNLQLTASDNRFLGNRAGLDGGGAFTFDSSMIGGRFENNGAGRDGGGVRVRRLLTSTGTQFINNRAANVGGGVVISSTFGGRTPNQVANALLARNQAAGGGSALSHNIDRSLNLLYSTIASPTLGAGPALYVVSGTVGITNTIIASQTTGIENTGGVVTENYNLFFGNNTNIQGVVGSGPDSFTGNPGFAGPLNDDYHLTGSSEAINRALDLGIVTDFEGEARPGGSGFDIGYDETDFVVELAVGKAASPRLDVTFRGGITYTVVLTNKGQLDAVNTTFTDTLPPEVDFARWIEQPGGASVTADQISWNGTVPGNSLVTFSFVVSHVGDYGDVVSNIAEYRHSTGSDADTIDFIVEPEVGGGPRTGPIYLPLIYKNFTTYVDLIVEDVVATTEGVTVTVRNVGNGTVIDAFWVDLYIDPDPPPTGVNQRWEDLGEHGLAWGVTGPVPPNGLLVLTIDGQYYRADKSNFSPLAAGTPVWVQVDSINFDTTYGNVTESNEENNIEGPRLSTAAASGGIAPATVGISSPSTGNLPRRE